MVFIDVEQAGKAVLNFVTSDKCKEIMACQSPSPKANFLAGVSIAYAVIMSECDKYVYSEKKDPIDAIAKMMGADLPSFNNITEAPNGGTENEV